MDRPEENTGETENRAAEAMAATAHQAADATASAAERVSESLDQGRAALADLQAALSERTREYVRTTDSYVRGNPWQAVGIAAGLGLMIGLLMGRR